MRANTRAIPALHTPGVLSAVDLAAIRADFPNITKPGIFPLSELSYGPAFERLIEGIRNPVFEDNMGEKYGVNLSDKPLMITVRGWAQQKDGRIHTDTKAKFVTCLLYLNDICDEGGGQPGRQYGPDDNEMRQCLAPNWCRRKSKPNDNRKWV